MKQKASLELFQYWNRLRDGRPAPRRAEVEPADIRTLLSDTFILERDTRGEAIFRLAGTRLCAAYGRELKGFAFSSLWHARDQRSISRLAGNVFSLNTVAVVDFRGTSRSGRRCLFELLLLPLDGGTAQPRCLGLATAAEAPFWLGADPVVENVAEAVCTVDPDEKTLLPGNRPAIPVPPLAPDRRDVASALPGRRVKHLLVLDGGRLQTL